LVGVAWWDSGGLQVEQFFMRDFAEEHSLLLALDARMAERRVLVTFNGKSFDWPLLETRYRMTRAIAPRTPAIHLDLLHPARQLWRPRLASVRLAELERHVLRVSPGSRLDWSRDYDVDSSQIPEIYFNFLRGGSAEPLVPVIRHNQMDLRGLAALASHMLEVIAAQQDEDGFPELMAADDALDLYGMSRFLVRRGESSLARRACSRALATGLPGEHDRAARRDLARLAKRMGDVGGAVDMWESLLSPARDHNREVKAASNEQSLTLDRILTRGAAGSHEFFAESGQLNAALEACEQLAIHFEHRARAFDRASQVARHGLALVQRARGTRRADDYSSGKEFCRKWEARFTHRLERIGRKMSVNPRFLSSAAR
ncbi:MAG TPA: ribonuclease H-like domain-containing protein, partial [Candidatus Acidoferrum sp.]|nr:ribonuclease H-like domain-containing protein [Candidatus Acidoferrum sp.]